MEIASEYKSFRKFVFDEIRSKEEFFGDKQGRTKSLRQNFVITQSLVCISTLPQHTVRSMLVSISELLVSISELQFP